MIETRTPCFPNAFPILCTDQLMLREYDVADAAALNHIRNHEMVNAHLFKRNAETVAKTAEVIGLLQQSFKKQTGMNWAIVEKATQQLIGYVGFWKIDHTTKMAELGYLLHPAWWKKGMMTEALQKVLKYGFESMGFYKVEAYVKPSNAASVLLLQKHGFREEAYLKDYCLKDNKPEDCLVFSKLATG